MKEFKQGEVIFRQGEPGDCMYDIFSGRVGIYGAYGTANEKLLTELGAGAFFGEMGLLEKEVRSATVVALEDVQAECVTEADFAGYLQKSPDKALRIMQQLSGRLRKLTVDYMDVCRTVYESVQAEKQGKTKSKSLLQKLDDIFQLYNEYERIHGSIDTNFFYY